VTGRASVLLWAGLLLGWETGSTGAVEVPASESRLLRVEQRGSGPLWLLLEDVDIEDIFAVLHRETGEAFVVSGGVAGRASLSLEGVSLEQALEALESFGVEVFDRGGVYVVSTPEAAPVADLARGGELLSLSLKRWSTEALASLLGESLGLPVDVPAGPLGRVTAFAEEVPRETLFGALFATAGLRYRTEADRVVLERPGDGPPEASRRLEGASPPSARPLSESSLEGLRLVGLSHRRGGEWSGWLYTTDRAICWGVRAGQQLRDGEIARVNRGGVLLEGTRGSFSGGPRRFRARLWLLPTGR
jgi:hypothetical protein